MKKTIAIIVAVVLLLFGGTISYAYTVSSISSFDPLGSGTNLSVECGGHSCGTVFFPGGSGLAVALRRPNLRRLIMELNRVGIIITNITIV